MHSPARSLLALGVRAHGDLAVAAAAAVCLPRAGRSAAPFPPPSSSVPGLPFLFFRLIVAVAVGFRRADSVYCAPISARHFFFMTAAYTDSHPTLYVVHERAKPVLFGPNRIELHTVLNECLYMLLSCFRKRRSDLCSATTQQTTSDRSSVAAT